MDKTHWGEMESESEEESESESEEERDEDEMAAGNYRHCGISNYTQPMKAYI